MSRAIIPIQNRLWAKIKRQDINECWEWQAALDSSGYGILGGGPGKPIKRAHRIAYEVTIGPIPNGLYICHHCDNKKCCNPRHLYAGTHSDNVKDFIKRNLRRSFKGTANPNSKYSNEQLIAIATWNKGWPAAKSRFGISKTHFYAIKKQHV